MKRRVFPLLSLLVILSFLAACGAQPAAQQPAAQESSGPVVLRFVTSETDPPSVDAYNQIIASYEKEHPNVKVMLELINTDDLTTKLPTLVATGNPPDISQLDPEQISPFSKEGHLLPLDDLADKIGRDDFVKGSLFQVNGHLYHLPYAGAGTVMWIRTDLFEKYGVKVPTTQAELLDAAQKLTLDTNGDGTTDLYGIALPAGTNRWTMNVFSMMVWQNGQSIFDCQLKPHFDTPAVVQALDLYGKLTKFAPPGIGSYSYYDGLDAMASGKIAMTPYMGRALSYVALNNPDLLDKIKAIPAVFFDKTKANYGGWNVYVAYSASKHPDQAKDFLAYLTTGEKAALFAKTVPGHLVPPTKSLMADPQLWDDPLMTSRKADVDLVFDTANYSLHPAYEACAIQNGQLTDKAMVNPYMNAVFTSNVLATAVQDVVLNGKTPEETAKWGQGVLDGIVAKGGE